MPINELDIKHLTQEAERDLGALKRVQAMLDREKAKSNGNTVSDRILDTAVPGTTTGLKTTVVEILKASGSGGRRPRDIVAALKKRGYSFKSTAVAASSVSTALKRLKEKGDAEKNVNNHYVWIGD